MKHLSTMPPELARPFSARSLSAATIVAAVAGVVLFAYTLARVGVGTVSDQLLRVGWRGFALVLALSGLRLAVRALAWTRCVEGGDRLRFRDAFSATLMGEALGNLTPFSTLISEPAKAMLVAGRLPSGVAFPALVVENLFYTASLAFVVVVGAVVFLLGFQVPDALRLAGLGAIAAMATVILAAFAVLRARVRPVSGTIGWLSDRGIAGRWLEGKLERIRVFETAVNTFWPRNRARVLEVAGLEAAFHAAGVAEVFITLWFIGAVGATGLLVALVLESAGRVINVAFRVVPMRLGVDEAGTELVARTVGLGRAAGVTLALVRKARIVVWTAAGILLLLARGLSVRGALAQARRAAPDANR